MVVSKFQNSTHSPKTKLRKTGCANEINIGNQYAMQTENVAQLNFREIIAFIKNMCMFA